MKKGPIPNGISPFNCDGPLLILTIGVKLLNLLL